MSSLNTLLTRYPGLHKWSVLVAVSAAFFFLNASTFSSLGVALYTMIADLHWSQTEAGFSFTLLGCACGLSSPLPTLVMKYVGGRLTITAGGLLLFLGFFLASISHSLMVFYLAMLLLGIGYSLAGNVPAVSLIAGFFQKAAARNIGVYYMLGAAGATLGPPVVQAILVHFGWRELWRVLAIVAAALGVLCYALIRDAAASTDVGAQLAVIPSVDPKSIHAPPREWRDREAIFTVQFMLVAASMAGTMLLLTTISSVAVTHLVKLGSTADTAAWILGIMALTAAVTKGVAGRLCERIAPSLLLATGVLVQAIGVAVLARADTAFLQYFSTMAFGVGWGLGYVAGTVVLLEYFGSATGSRILGIVWLLATSAAAGPLAAGVIADRYGTFAPIFILFGVGMLILALPIFVMRAPVQRGVSGHPAGAE